MANKIKVKETRTKANHGFGADGSTITEHRVIEIESNQKSDLQIEVPVETPVSDWYNEAEDKGT